MSFAKLYETEVGQILCKLDQAKVDGNEAEIRIYFEPPSLGVCEFTLNYKTWELADIDWEPLDEKKATNIVKALLSDMPKFGVCDE